MIAEIHSELDEHLGVLQAIRNDAALLQAVENVAQCCINSLRQGGKLLIAGNGGSAADAQHWVAEIVGRYGYDRPGLPAIALTVDTSILTAVGNDYGYEQVFARQVQALARPGDVLFAISTSGNSPNIVAAAQAALVAGVTVVGWTGQSGGKLQSLSTWMLRMPSGKTARIQEGHAVLGHIICGLIEQAMYPRTQA